MTKRIKETAVALALAVMMFAGSYSYAKPTLLVNAVGSTGAFQAFAIAALSGSPATCGTNSWTAKNVAAGVDGRSNQIPLEVGNIWIVWNNTMTQVCSYLAVDSVIGQQLFFAVPRATLSIPSGEIGQPGANLIPNQSDTPLPSAIYSALNGKTFNCAPTDIRPEDALFAENRALAPLDSKYDGLGYGPGPIGTPVVSFFSGTTSTPVAWNLTGNDPITGEPVKLYTTTDVGAQALMVVVNNLQTGSSGDFSNVSAFQNINRFDLTQVLNGTYGLTRDISSTPGLPAVPMNVITREPTSGTYNTLEFNIPRNIEFNSTQELGVNPGAGGNNNPLNLPNGAAPLGGGSRWRAVGNGEELKEVANSANGNVLGYGFWSTGNYANYVNDVRYLTVDGVDPLFANYAGGFFPTCTIPCPGVVQFTNILNGSYPIWNVLRVTSGKPMPAGVAALIAASQDAVINDSPDYVAISQLNVFRSHFSRPQSKKTSNGHISGVQEAGGDVGGCVITVQADLDSVKDTGKEYIGCKD